MNGKGAPVLEGFVDVSVIARPGVYALVWRGEVVYVGQASRATVARIEAHRSNWGKKRLPAWMPASLRGVLFDQVFVLPCTVDLLDEVERTMIDLYKPKFNIKLKAPTPLTSVSLTLNHNGIAIPINHRPPSAFPRRI